MFPNEIFLGALAVYKSPPFNISNSHDRTVASQITFSLNV